MFGRRGSRPLNTVEAQRLYLHDGKVYTVSNDPLRRPAEMPEPGLLTLLRDYWRRVKLAF